LGNGKTLAATNLAVGTGTILVLSGGKVQTSILNLAGGQIIGTGTVDVSSFGSMSGYGVVSGNLTASNPRTRVTVVGGDMTLGNLNATTGYAYGGELSVLSQKLVLLDKNAADLGSKTTLAGTSTLATVNGANLSAGQSLVFSGHSSVLGNFTNNGSVRFEPTLLGHVGLPNSAGSLTFLNDVDGAGQFSGNVIFHAGYSPGNSPAAIDFGGGNASYDSTATLTMEIFGNTAGAQYDQLLNINTLTFNGTLNLVFGKGFVPLAGSSFALFRFNSFSGSFAQDHITVTGYDRNLLDFSRLASMGTLSVAAPVPEPETWLMLLAGLGLMGYKRSTKPTLPVNVAAARILAAPPTPNPRQVSFRSASTVTHQQVTERSFVVDSKRLMPQYYRKVMKRVCDESQGDQVTGR